MKKKDYSFPTQETGRANALRKNSLLFQKCYTRPLLDCIETIWSFPSSHCVLVHNVPTHEQ